MSSVNKRKNIVPIALPIGDVVSKYVTKTPHPKRAKAMTRLEIDDKIGKWIVEVSNPKVDGEASELFVDSYHVERVELGVADRDTDNHHFEVFAKCMLTRSQKDGKDKKELKQMIRVLADYIHAISGVSSSPKPLAQASQSFDPASPANQKLLSQIQRGKAIATVFDDWVNGVINDGCKFI